MMTKKKTQEKPKFEVKKRAPKEKPDYFKNLTPFAHPVAEILNFPAEIPEQSKESESLLPESEASSLPENNYPPENSKNADSPESTVPSPSYKFASNLNTSLLAEPAKSASLLTPLPKLLADLNVKSASKLAKNHKSASRTKSQLLADLRQSKGNRIQIAIRIRPHVKQAINVFMAKYGISQQDFLELSASSFIENYEKQLADLSLKGASLLGHDDRRLTLWKTTPLIINLYLRYNAIFNTNPKWTVKDDDTGKSYNDVDIRIIELGFIQTHFNRGFRSGKINSFQYYTNQIDEMNSLNFNEDTLNAMLNINRQRWAQTSGKEIDLTFLEKKSSSKQDV